MGANSNAPSARERYAHRAGPPPTSRLVEQLQSSPCRAPLHRCWSSTTMCPTTTRTTSTAWGAPGAPGARAPPSPSSRPARSATRPTSSKRSRSLARRCRRCLPLQLDHLDGLSHAVGSFAASCAVCPSSDIANFAAGSLRQQTFSGMFHVPASKPSAVEDQLLCTQH